MEREPLPPQLPPGAIELTAPYILFVKTFYLCQVFDGLHERLIIVKSYLIKTRHLDFFRRRGEHIRVPCRCNCNNRRFVSQVVIYEDIRCVQPRPGFPDHDYDLDN